MCCYVFVCFFFFFKQKTAYEMRISDWSSDVCSSDLSFARVTWHASSPLKAIRAMAPDAEVTYVDGSDPVAAAKAAAGADVAIVFATQWTTEAEDAQRLSLPHDPDALIAAVAQAQRNSLCRRPPRGPVLLPWPTQG